MPDFLLIGAQECATSVVGDNLRLHPAVHIAVIGPARPEMQFFHNKPQTSKASGT